MTGKRFTIKRKDLKYAKILENDKDLTGYFFITQAEFICDKWNELHEEKEYWKGNACSNSNFVNILLHELDLAQEKGYEVSDPFKKIMEEKS